MFFSRFINNSKAKTNTEKAGAETRGARKAVIEKTTVDGASQQNLQHSQAFENMLKTLNATGAERAYGGYDAGLLDKIYDWERDEAEDIIWYGLENDIRLAMYFPKLTKYDGTDALKKRLPECIIPSQASADLARELYEATGEEHYLDVIKKNVDAAKNSSSYVVALLFCKPCEHLYSLLEEIYLENESKEARSVAAKGLLICKGMLESYTKLQMNEGTIGLLEKFDVDSREEREKILEDFRRVSTTEF